MLQQPVLDINRGHRSENRWLSYSVHGCGSRRSLLGRTAIDSFLHDMPRFAPTGPRQMRRSGNVTFLERVDDPTLQKSVTAKPKPAHQGLTRRTPCGAQITRGKDGPQIAQI